MSANTVASPTTMTTTNNNENNSSCGHNYYVPLFSCRVGSERSEVMIWQEVSLLPEGTQQGGAGVCV